MKILISGSKLYYFLASSFFRAFKKLNLKVEIFDDEGIYRKQFYFLKNRFTNRIFWKIFSLTVQRKFVETVINRKPELILVVKGWFFSPTVIKTIKNELSKSKIFCFNPDNPFNTWHFGASNIWIRKSIPYYDVYFIWGKFLIERLKKNGAKRVEYLPFAYDPELHYPLESLDKEKKNYDFDVVFIGTWDEEREKWLKNLLDYNLVIWGNGWERANKELRRRWRNRAVVGKEFSKVCNSSKIVLNLIRRQNLPAHNMKTFEIPACKGFMLSNRTEEVIEFFKENEEIACFSSLKELRKKIGTYLINDNLRKNMKEKAYRKVENHTYVKRARKILEVYSEIDL